MKGFHHIGLCFSLSLLASACVQSGPSSSNKTLPNANANEASTEITNPNNKYLRSLVPHGFRGAFEAFLEKNPSKDFKVAMACEQGGRAFEPKYFNTRMLVITEDLKDTDATQSVPVFALFTTSEGVPNSDKKTKSKYLLIDATATQERLAWEAGTGHKHSIDLQLDSQERPIKIGTFDHLEEKRSHGMPANAGALNLSLNPSSQLGDLSFLANVRFTTAQPNSVFEAPRAFAFRCISPIGADLMSQNIDQLKSKLILE